MTEFLCQMLALINLNSEACTQTTHARVLKIIDGDTITVQAKTPQYAPNSNTITIRILGINAPEINGKCTEEKRKAKQAANYLKQKIPPGTIVKLTSSPRGWQKDPYQRILAKITHNKTDLGQDLIKNGLAAKWNSKTHQQNWCKK